MDETDNPMIAARWVFPVVGPPLRDGVVSISQGGIDRVGPAGFLTPDVHLGNVALLPGLVNAHTHFDLSGLRHRIHPSPDFTGWLTGVIRARLAASPEHVAADVRAGAAESAAAGVALVGDIAGTDHTWPALRGAPLSATVFREFLGLTPERADAAIARMREWAASHAPTRHLRPGLSPHAPYSVRHTLFRAAAELKLPLAVHLAESPDEARLLESRDGPFAEFLRSLNVWDADGLCHSHAELLDAVESAPSLAAVHANFLPASLGRGANTCRVYCPRTHAAFGWERYPLAECVAAGLPVALGTDSLASNPDLDLLAEVWQVRATHPEIGGAEILRMATINGARVLGWEGRFGAIAPGCAAHFIAVPLPDADDWGDPHGLLFAQPLPAVGSRRVIFPRAAVSDSPGDMH